MANEFKIKKGLIVTGASGGTVVDIQGSQGQLFSVTDDLSGSIFAVSDISGVPILDVNSSGLVTVDGPFTQTGGGATILSGTLDVDGEVTIGSGEYLSWGTSGATAIEGSTVSNRMRFYTDSTLALTLESSQNATFAGDVTVSGGDITVSNAITGISGGSFRVKNNGGTTIATFADDLSATFAAQAFATTATSSGNASSTLTTKGYVDSLITGATIYRGAWQAGISATSSAATTASTTLTVTAAILDGDGNTPVLVGAVVTGEGITGIVKVASVTSSTVYVLDTAITATATAYIFSPIYGAPDLSGVTETSGYYYICSEAGSATPNGANSEPNTWNVGDWCIYNDVSGTGQWQKIDNSSVLSGVGTGQTVALWEGPSSVTDSDTLGNAPITFNGNNATFAGNVIAEGSLITRSVNANVTISGDTSGNIYYNNASGEHRWRANGSSVNSMNLSSTLLTVNEPATFTGIITVNGGGIDIDNDDDIRLRFDNASTFKAGLQVATTAGDMIAGSAIDDFAIRAQGNMLFSSGGNVEVLRLDTSGNATFAGNVTAADLLTVNGDGHLFLGADGETPKIDMMYDDHASGAGWDTRIFTGKTDDLPNGQSFPTSTIAGGYGTQYQANSDGAFFGIIPYAAGHYRPIINWGDDVTDTPFSFQFNGSDIVTINYVGDITAPIFQGDHKGTINTATTGVTQTAGNDSTLIATTEFVTDAVATGVGNYLPLAGGTMNASANINMNSGSLSSVDYIDFGIGQLNGVSTSNLILKSLGDITYNVDSNNNGNSSHIFQESGSELMRIRYDGNVGINTSSPVVRLHVQGNNIATRTTTTAQSVLRLVRDVVDTAFPSTKDSAVDFMLSRQQTVNNNLPYTRLDIRLAGTTDSSTPSLDVMSLLHNGNVGIGTTNPRDALEVVGNIRFVEGEDHLMIKPNSSIHGADFIVGDGVATTDTPVMSLNGLYGGKVTIQTQGNSVADKTVFDVQGTQGQLFSVTDDLSGSIFAVSDISGVPIFDVNSSGVSYFDGNVGIGTSSPAAKLEVQGTNTAGDLALSNSSTTVSSGDTLGKLAFRNYDGSINFSTFSGEVASIRAVAAVDFTGTNGANTDLLFYTNSVSPANGSPVSGGSEKMRILANGNVGIGTISPGSTLTLGNATGNVAELRVLRSNSLSNSYGFINTTGGTAQLGGSGDARIISSTGRLLFNSNNTDQISLESNGEYRLKLGSTTTGYEASMDNSNTAYRIFGSRFGGTGKYVAIWSDGANENTRFYPTKTIFYKNVGIGVTGPGEKLTIGDTGNVGMSITDGTHTQYVASIATANAYGNGSTVGQLYLRGYDGIGFSGDQGGATHMTLLTGGDVGIGDTTPSYKLDVAGTIRATGDVIAFSDVRVKENIKTIKSSLDKVSRLRGVEFNKIGEDEKSIGVIAQEIEKVIPEVVKTDDEGMKSVAYGNISGLLIEAIKELKAEVDLLKSKPCNCNCKK